MNIISLQLFNFRQFYGQTPIIKFGNGKKNTTIIHGNNGSGKTTILNAFTWVLYEEFTGAFNEPKSLINKRAIQELQLGEKSECFVEIVFEHDYKTYQLKRKCCAYRHQNKRIEISQPQLFMMVADDDGTWKPPLQQPQDILERILPQSLYQYFFFDGEHIDHLVRGEERQKIAEDTKELVGIKVLERAVNHLKNAEKTLQNELTTLGDIQIKKLVAQKEEHETQVAKLKAENKLVNQRLNLLKQEKDNLTQKMLFMSGIENLQQLKQRLLQEEKELRNQLVSAKQAMKKKISTQGYLVLAKPIWHQFQQFMADLRPEQEVPLGIKKQFLAQLLAAKKCICGQDLSPQTQAYEEIVKWQAKANNLEIEEALIKLENQVEQFPARLEEFWQAVNQYKTNLNQWRFRLSEVETKLDELNDQLRQYPDANIQSTQQKLDHIEQHIRQLTLNQGEINGQMDTLEDELKDLDKQLKKQEIKVEKHNLILRRINATQEAIACILEVQKRLENQFRVALEKRLQEIFRSISFTPYQPHLSENYELSLLENTSGTNLAVAASTGENAIDSG